jgi:uncharacterized protein (TIGR02265 family)
MLSLKGFVEPDFSAPIDVQAQKALVPPGGTVKGMHLAALVDRCAEAGHPYEKRDYIAFYDYPGEELLDLLVESAARCFPVSLPREGLRRLGHLAYPALARSPIGRVVFGLVGSDPTSLVKLVSKGYAISNSSGTARVLDTTDEHAVLRLEGMYSFIDSWHVGIIEGAAKTFGRDPKLLIKVRSPTAADFLVHW